MSQLRGAHRAAPPSALGVRRWPAWLDGLFAGRQGRRRSGRRRGRHAAPPARGNWRKSAYAVAGVAALTAGMSMTWTAESSAGTTVLQSRALAGDGGTASRSEAPSVSPTPVALWLAQRVETVRSAERLALQQRAAAQAVAEAQYAKAVAAAQADPRGVARRLVAERGWPAGEFGCLETLWTKESNWRYTATNPTSGAYGIAQSLPANKMASVGPDWQTNPATQIAWGLGYIKAVYGTPCAALNFHYANNWY